jgi:hypothetical protein
MRTFTIFLAVMTLGVLAGCSSYTITSDYDSNASFASLKTYKWAIDPANASGNLLLKNQLLGKRVKAAIDSELAAKGMTLVTSGDADLIVASHLTTKDKLNITDWGYGYGGGWYHGYGGYGSNVDVTQYTEGTLVIDLINGKAKDLIWRGVATGAIASTPPPPEELEARIKEVVGAILAEYPPQK